MVKLSFAFNSICSRYTGLGIAFGIAGSVLVAACGAAFKYVSDKVEEERAKYSKSGESSSSSS